MSNLSCFPTVHAHNALACCEKTALRENASTKFRQDWKQISARGSWNTLLCHHVNIMGIPRTHDPRLKMKRHEAYDTIFLHTGAQGHHHAKRSQKMFWKWVGSNEPSNFEFNYTNYLFLTLQFRRWHTGLQWSWLRIHGKSHSWIEKHLINANYVLLSTHWHRNENAYMFQAEVKTLHVIARETREPLRETNHCWARKHSYWNSFSQQYSVHLVSPQMRKRRCLQSCLQDQNKTEYCVLLEIVVLPETQQPHCSAQSKRLTALRRWSASLICAVAPYWVRIWLKKWNERMKFRTNSGNFWHFPNFSVTSSQDL